MNTFSNILIESNSIHDIYSITYIEYQKDDK